MNMLKSYNLPYLMSSNLVFSHLCRKRDRNHGTRYITGVWGVQITLPQGFRAQETSPGAFGGILNCSRVIG